jgi:hypothetical protein
MRSLRVDGLTKALNGQTTLEEVLRTTPAEVHGPQTQAGTVERRTAAGKGRPGGAPDRRRSA